MRRFRRFAKKKKKIHIHVEQMGGIYYVLWSAFTHIVICIYIHESNLSFVISTFNIPLYIFYIILYYNISQKNSHTIRSCVKYIYNIIHHTSYRPYYFSTNAHRGSGVNVLHFTRIFNAYSVFSMSVLDLREIVFGRRMYIDIRRLTNLRVFSDAFDFKCIAINAF